MLHAAGIARAEAEEIATTIDHETAWIACHVAAKAQHAHHPARLAVSIMRRGLAEVDGLPQIRAKYRRLVEHAQQTGQQIPLPRLVKPDGS